MIVGAFLFPVSPIAPSFLVHDTYTDVNGTPIGSHVLDTGGNWTRTKWPTSSQNMDTTIEGNQLETRNNAVVGFSFDFHHKDHGNADVTVNKDVEATTEDASGRTTNIGLCYRITDGDNVWYSRLLGVSASQIDSQIIEKTSGTTLIRSSTTIATGLPTASVNAFQMNLVLNGTSISLKVDGANEITFTSSIRQAVTNHGFQVFSSQDIDVPLNGDNYEATAT